MLRIKVTGAVQNATEEWGVMFGPLSDVDAEIDGSNGLTLRKLYEAGEIPADCFEEDNEPVDQMPAEERE